MEPRISLVTLGVADLERATRFYEQVRHGQRASWGGYTVYFADPDGFLREVAWNPNFPHV